MSSRYSSLNRYIIRTPLLSIENTAKLEENDIKNLFTSPLIQEAIFSASSEFYEEAKKWLQEESVKSEERVVFTLLKYLLRMGARATPFGFFSGLAVGTISESTEILLNRPEEHKAITRLDMDFLSSLSQSLENDTEVRPFLRYYPNTSLYRVGEEFRYIEHQYSGTLRRHYTSSVDFSDFLNSLLEASKKGLTILELAELIVEPEISLEAATDFIHELIDNQVLISSIAPSVSGEDYLFILEEQLKEIKEVNSKLSQFSSALNNTNKQVLGEKLKTFSLLYEIADYFQINYKRNYLLQTDLILSFKHNTISDSLIKRANEAFEILVKMSIYEESKELKKFKKEFYKKYEEEEIPLALALDIESGIGFGYNIKNFSDVSPLIDDINWGFKIEDKSSKIKLAWSARDAMLYKKIVETIKSGKQVIELTDKDLKDFKGDWGKLPDTFSMFMNVLNEHEAPYLNIVGVGDETAATTLGRFCHTDKNLKEHVNQILKVEEEMNDSILAEIVHLPEKRVGNILHRPQLRDYEIPYLSLSTKPIENQIRIDDLMVSIKEDRIFLRSKSLNKEIIPKLTTAHNYEFNSLPIYHFLAQMQLHQRNGDLSFSWGSLYHLFDFLPRVMYKGVIISRAEWTVNKKAIKQLVTRRNIEEFREKFKLPTVFVLAEADNELLIDTNHELSVRMFLNEIKNKNNILLKEFLFKEGISPVVNKKGRKFVNEVVLSYIKAQ